MMTKNALSTKKGIASFYVVIFMTLLLGVIVAGFIRLVVSESTQNVENDLAQSAYDSALVGVEDAKTLLAQNIASPISGFYYSDGSNVTSESCNMVGTLLGRSVSENGTVVQTQIDGEDVEEQAYTCVTISNVVPDYRSTLSSEHSTRVITLNQSGIKSVKISWHSTINNDTNYVWGSYPYFSDASKAPNPPVITAQLIQMTGSGTVTDLNTNLDDGYGQSTAVLYPANQSGHNSYSAASPSNPIKISCNTGEEFLCSATAELSVATDSSDQLYLVLSLPYNTKGTDFSVVAYNASGNVLNFENVQYSIDSTGRANDVYSRVESRVEFTNAYATYPEYVISLSGGSNNESDFTKNVYVTSNCWSTQDGSSSTCDNYGTVGQ